MTIGPAAPALLTCLCLAAVAPSRAAAPLRLPNGEPLVCIYYFTHWWEPWKSDDEAIRQDLRRLRGMGFNTLLLDQEWSQAIDGNWKLLDRANRLAGECGMSVVPWLSPKTWSDITPGNRQRLAREWFGVDVKYGVTQDGKPTAPLIYDEAIISAGTQYTLMYLERYLAGPVLRLNWEGKIRPVVSLSVETAWCGSFDERTNERFRSWLESKYRSVTAMNAAWGTALASFAAVNPCDTTVFDYPGQVAGQTAHPQAVEDHVAFRAATITATLRQIGAAVRQKYPDVLLLAETPYQYEGQHPHAEKYRIEYGANPESCDWADVVLFRCTGPLSSAETAALQRHEQRTGQRFVLTYRTYSDWDVAPAADSFARSVEGYAGQAAELGSGFGFYSYNEMVDTHVAYSTALPAAKQPGWTAERAERAIGLMAAMVKRYLEKTRQETRIMHIAPRYARIYTDPGVDEAEANYGYRELPMDMPLQDAALVCVDCWSWHFSRETLERTEQITRDHIVPLLEACRRQGLLVIHAPADPVASRHPNWVHLKAPADRPQAPWPDSPAWPPAEFRQKTGAYAAFARPFEPQQEYRNEHARTKRDFHALVRPVGDEPVVCDGEELHRLCAQRKILHLFFIGFNTNACIMMRDYGLPAMTARGYTGILVRDCTTGMELADTLKDLTCTRGTIASIEQFLGYTVTSQQLVEALDSAR